MKKIKNISSDTLSKIINEKIKPIPRWEFVMKNFGIWIGLGISVIILIVGMGLSWFGLIDNLITPYLWVVVTIVFLGISYLLFENTKKAYRFSKKWIILLIIGIGMVAGIAVYKLGLADEIDRNLEYRLPYYRMMSPMKMQTWMNPKSGYLAGVITRIKSINEFELKDFNNRTWVIKTDKTLIRGRVQMIVGSQIKIIGKIEGNIFVATEIRPWMGMIQN